MPRTHRRTAALLAAAAGIFASRPAAAIPLFQELPNAFGTQPCGPGTKLGCFTNYLRVTNIDGDGDLDVLFPNADGYFQQGAQIEPFVVYRNDGSAGFTDVSAAAVGGFTGYLRQIAVGDVDGDGDNDIYAPAAWGAADAFFIHQSGGAFVDQAAQRLPGVTSHAGAARFGDVDNDGDLDLLVSDGWVQASAFVAHLYLNDGTGFFTDKSENLPTTKSGNQPIDFDLLDVDNDFDLDLYIDMHTGTSSLWRNDGNGVFTDITSGIPDQSNLHYGPVACDVDGDGDLDIWSDNSGPSLREQLFINDGTGVFTDESTARITGNQAADDNGVVCVDIEGDGDFDAIIMSLSSVERVLVNDGTGKFTPMNDAFPSISDPTLWLDVGDLNGDGRLDVVTGQGEGGNWTNRVYLGTNNMPVDTFPPRFRAVETLGGVQAGVAPIVHYAVTDSATTDEGPRLSSAFVRVTTPDSMTDVPAHFMGGDLFRAELSAQPDGTEVTYSVCAVDLQGNEGCAQPKSYIVGQPATTGAGGSGATGSGGGTTGAGANSGTPGGAVDDGGCGCAVPGGAGRAAGALALGALAAALLFRRRRAS